MYIKSVTIVGSLKTVTISVDESTVGVSCIINKDEPPKYFSADGTPGDICVKFDRFADFRSRYDAFGEFCVKIAELVEPTPPSGVPTTEERLHTLLSPLWETAMLDSEADW